MLPNFLIIGAPRSATTFLKECASEHPQVYMAALGKYAPDIHFFDVCTDIGNETNFEKGIEWYRQLFQGATSETAIGEKTVHYLCDPRAPELISRYLPHARMIAILRNPIERAYSEYQYHMGRIPLNMGFLEACYAERTKRLTLLKAGFYYEQIMRYLGYFDRSQFLFLLYDDLQADPLGTVQRAFKFLDVDVGFVPSQVHQRVNAAMTKKRTGYCLRTLGGLVKQNFPRLFRLAQVVPVTRLIEEKIGRDSITDSKTPQYQSMSAEERTKLSSVYYEHDCRLADFLDRDLVGLWHN
jgi:hypothetical protein